MAPDLPSPFLLAVHEVGNGDEQLCESLFSLVVQENEPRLTSFSAFSQTSILTMLLRLRQGPPPPLFPSFFLSSNSLSFLVPTACDHPVLVSKSFASDPDAIAPKSTNAAKEDSDEADELADLFGGLGVAKTFKCTICSSDLDKGVKDFCSDGCRSIGRRAREASVEGSDTPPSSAKIREIRRILKDVKEKGDGGEKTISEFTSQRRIKLNFFETRSDLSPLSFEQFSLRYACSASARA